MTVSDAHTQNVKRAWWIKASKELETRPYDYRRAWNLRDESTLSLSEALDLLTWVAEETGHNWSFSQGPDWFHVEGDNTETDEEAWFWWIGHDAKEPHYMSEVTLEAGSPLEAVLLAIDVIVERHIDVIQP